MAGSQRGSKAAGQCLGRSLYLGSVHWGTNHHLQLVNRSHTHLEHKHVYTHQSREIKYIQRQFINLESLKVITTDIKNQEQKSLLVPEKHLSGCRLFRNLRVPPSCLNRWHTHSLSVFDVWSGIWPKWQQSWSVCLPCRHTSLSGELSDVAPG